MSRKKKKKRKSVVKVKLSDTYHVIRVTTIDFTDRANRCCAKIIIIIKKQVVQSSETKKCIIHGHLNSLLYVYKEVFGQGCLCCSALCIDISKNQASNNS